MSQPAWKRSARMLAAKTGSPPSAVAKPSAAFGAMSWTISSIAVPSSSLLTPSWPGSTSTSGSSPAACEALSDGMPVDSTQTFVPTPVTWRRVRAMPAACAASPSETTACAIQPLATPTCRTPFTAATSSTAPSGTRARTLRAPCETTCAPAPASRLSRSGPAFATSTSTTVVPRPLTGAPRTARGIRVAPACRRSVITSRLSSLRSAVDSERLTFCSAAI
jgi:hypothetical protein